MQPSHDQLFHFVLRHRELAAAWIRSLLPRDEADLIDWRTFAPVQERIPGIRLRTHVADLVFVAKRLDCDEYVWFVIEHKSEVAPDWREQLLRYCVHLRRVVQRTRTHLPDIVMVLFHHGVHAVPLANAADAPEPFARFAPHLPVVVVDLAVQPPESMPADLPPLVHLLFRCQHAILRCTTAELLAAIESWRDLLQAVERSPGPPLPEDALDAIGWYLVEHSDLTETQVLMALSKNLREPQGMKMTTGQRIRMQSRAEGHAEGVAQGVAQGTVRGRAEALQRLLDKRFGPLPPDVRARLDTAGLPAIDLWTDRILDARSLDDVFGA